MNAKTLRILSFIGKATGLALTFPASRRRSVITAILLWRADGSVKRATSANLIRTTVFSQGGLLASPFWSLTTWSPFPCRRATLGRLIIWTTFSPFVRIAIGPCITPRLRL